MFRTIHAWISCILFIGGATSVSCSDNVAQLGHSARLAANGKRICRPSLPRHGSAENFSSLKGLRQPYGEPAGRDGWPLKTIDLPPQKRSS